LSSGEILIAAKEIVNKEKLKLNHIIMLNKYGEFPAVALATASEY
jgi:hypothetical protein